MKIFSFLCFSSRTDRSQKIQAVDYHDIERKERPIFLLLIFYRRKLRVFIDQ